ncbi:MAG: L,D-transpeptidase family protein [Lachnospiraceae bacterium]|nr:L,D-transpeptidase family protein [Lachnospiraceae bacterium]
MLTFFLLVLLRNIVYNDNCVKSYKCNKLYTKHVLKKVRIKFIMSTLRRIKDYIYENRQLILASVLSSLAIIAIIIILSTLKQDNQQIVASDGELSSVNSEGNLNSESSTTTFHSESESESETTAFELSDMEFTLPEDSTDEIETTFSQSDDSYKYLIKVNRLLNCVTVYTKDANGEYTVPYKAMACSTGKNINNTPLGTFRTSSKYTWRLMVDGTHSQYATRVYGGILFHSVPCYAPQKNQLEYEEFNKLGSPASLGCIRLTVADSKWIYDNCPSGTTVIIYDDAESPGPLGKPSVITIPAESPYKGWDPTDPDPNNPWNAFSPSIVASDVTANVGTDINLLSIIKATDTCGNDISSSVSINGSYDKNTPGTYVITYSVTDLLGRSASKTITIKIVNSSTTTTTPSTGSTTGTTTGSTTKPTASPTTKPTTKPTETTQETTTSSSVTEPTTTPQSSDAESNYPSGSSESATTAPYDTN